MNIQQNFTELVSKDELKKIIKHLKQSKFVGKEFQHKS